jgi:protein-S-isoprenylcysteine O-methyltransferase Ste14
MTAEDKLKRKGHGDREDLIGEHPAGDAGQLILAVIFLTVWVADSFFLKYTTFLSGYIPLPVRVILSAAVLALGGYLAKKGHDIVFGQVREKPGIFREGVFGLVRHPLYSGGILFYAGLLFLSPSLAAGAVWLAAIAFYIYIARHEEKLLIREFGDEYREYMREVPLLFPVWKKGGVR